MGRRLMQLARQQMFQGMGPNGSGNKIGIKKDEASNFDFDFADIGHG